MALTNINDNFQIDAPKHLDNRVGNYNSVNEANLAINPAFRVQGLEVYILVDGSAVKYFYKDGILDEHLIPFTSAASVSWGSIAGTLSTQTDLQTALNAKFDDPTGSTSQYLDGTGAPKDFPTTTQAGTLVREVRNQTGSTLTKGTIVYISGASGNKALVSKAVATSDSTSAQTFGVIQADIPTNQNGYVVIRGDLSGLDTSAYSEGAQLYLSSTTAGTYTNTKQYAPAHLVYIGIVTRSHANQGSIEVAIQNGYELDELHNVQAQNPANRNTIIFDNADSQWKAGALNKTDIGLSNVDNTSDINKPVSTAAQTALNLKANISDLSSYAKVLYRLPSAVNVGNSTSVIATTITTFDITGLAVGTTLIADGVFSSTSNANTKTYQLSLSAAGTHPTTTATQGGIRISLLMRVQAANTIRMSILNSFIGTIVNPSYVDVTGTSNVFTLQTRCVVNGTGGGVPVNTLESLTLTII